MEKRTYSIIARVTDKRSVRGGHDGTYWKISLLEEGHDQANEWSCFEAGQAVKVAVGEWWDVLVSRPPMSSGSGQFRNIEQFISPVDKPEPLAATPRPVVDTTPLPMSTEQVRQQSIERQVALKEANLLVMAVYHERAEEYRSATPGATAGLLADIALDVARRYRIGAFDHSAGPGSGTWPPSDGLDGPYDSENRRED